MVRGKLTGPTPTYSSGRVDRSANVPVKKDRAEFQKDLARQRAKDAELVVGVFKNMETPGVSLRFSYHKYHNDPYEVYELFDGETYQLPRGVAKWLNNNCFYREYRHLAGHSGETGMRSAYNDGRLNASSMHEARKVYRFAFHSLDYMEDDLDVQPAKPLYEVSA